MQAAACQVCFVVCVWGWGRETCSCPLAQQSETNRFATRRARRLAPTSFANISETQAHLAQERFEVRIKAPLEKSRF